MQNKKLMYHYLLYAIISISLLSISETIFSKVRIAHSGASLDILPDASLRAQFAQDKPISLYELPYISNIPMPDGLKNMLQKIKVKDVTIFGSSKLLILDFDAYINGDEIDVRMRIAKKGISPSDEAAALELIAEQEEGEKAELIGEGGAAESKGSYTWSLMVTMPSEFKLSTISSEFKPLDLEVKKGIFAITNNPFEDPDWGRIGEGVTFGGIFKVEGKLKKLLNILKIQKVKFIIG